MLLDRFRTHFAGLALPDTAALVAVSGGRDSAALLDLLVRSGSWTSPLAVVHVDHGIDPASGAAEALVRRMAEAHGLPYECVRLALGAGTTETTARAARYAAIERVRLARGAELVFLAHHADDQVETVLMRVLRGSGPLGLAAMVARSGPYVRPLLPFRRAELAEYVAGRDIATWEDAANVDPRHLRSWMRGTLLPLVEARLPDVRERLIGTSRQARRNRVAWDLVLEMLPRLDLRREGGVVSVAAPVLGGYDSALGAAVLIALGLRAGCTIGEARAARVLRLARCGSSGRSVPIARGWRAELAFDRLRLLPPQEPADAALDLEIGDRVRWGSWTVTLASGLAPPEHERRALTAWFPDVPLTMRAPRAGDRIAPIGGRGHRLVVRCFQDARVPSSLRPLWPVVEANGVVVWVPGVCRAGALVPPAGAEAIRVDVTHD